MGFFKINNCGVKTNAFFISIALLQVTSDFALAQESLEEVTVSAQRREQSVQDVPVSITALSAKHLKSLKIERSTDLADQVPNIQIEEQFGLTGPRITVRGIVNADFNAVSNTPVTVYSDDVVLNSIQDHGFAMYDLDRVELLRGPQGTFFGRNSATGAIQFYSARPTAELSGHVGLTYAEFDQIRIEGAISGPLGDSLLGRFAFLSNNGDGHIDNLADGSTGPEADDLSFRTYLTYENDNFDASFKVQYSEGDGEAITFHNILPINVFDGVPNAGPSTDFQQIQLDRAERSESIESIFSSAVLNWDFGEHVLTSVTGYSEHDFFNFDDDDATTSQFFDEFFQNAQDQFSQEIRVATAHGEDIQWILGAYYLTEDVSSRTNFEFSGFFGPLGATGFASNIAVTQDLESYSIFGQADYAFADEWSFSLGLRWSNDDKSITHSVHPCYSFDRSASNFSDIENYTSPLITGDCTAPPNIAGATPAQNESWSDTSGKVSLNYTPSEDTLVYASIARGFKGGGFNGGAEQLAQFSVVDPEIVLAYEVGAKLKRADGKVILNMGAFFFDYTDMQQFTIGFEPGSLSLARRLVNVPEANNVGFEIEAYTRPIKGLTVNFGVGYVDTEFTDFINDAGDNFNGNKFPGAPELSFNGLLQYEIPVSFGYIIPQVDFSYVDEYFADVENTRTLTFGLGDTGFPEVDGQSFDVMLGDFWDLNLRLTLTNNDQNMRLTAFVENVTDEVQFTNHFDTSAFGVGSTITTIRKPQVYGVSFTYEF